MLLWEQSRQSIQGRQYRSILPTLAAHHSAGFVSSYCTCSWSLPYNDSHLTKLSGMGHLYGPYMGYSMGQVWISFVFDMGPSNPYDAMYCLSIVLSTGKMGIS